MCLIVVLLKQKSNLRPALLKLFPLSRVECGATLWSPGESSAQHHLDQEEQGPGGPGPLCQEQTHWSENFYLKRVNQIAYRIQIVFWGVIEKYNNEVDNKIIFSSFSHGIHAV